METNATPKPVHPVFFVFDVEAVGLYGDAFWVGWVIIDATGREVSAGGNTRGPDDEAAGNQAGRKWVARNVPSRPAEGAASLMGMRDAFWAAWTAARVRFNAILAADCPWPVEARFLLQCLDDYPRREGPYPLIDIASVRLAAGLDPLGHEERKMGELPRHSPHADATQSARLLIEALGKSAFHREVIAEDSPPRMNHQHLTRIEGLRKSIDADIDRFEELIALDEEPVPRPPEDPPPLDETST